jgi:sigma-E factor negative regulatory protein RseC
MICQHGFISDINHGQALIRVQPRTACQACSAGKGCGMGLFTGWMSTRGVAIEVASESDWQVGDSVAVQVTSSELTRLASLAYGLPLLAFLLAAAAMAAWLPAGPVADLGAGLAGVAALVGSAWWLGHRARPRTVVGRVANPEEIS